MSFCLPVCLSVCQWLVLSILRLSKQNMEHFCKHLHPQGNGNQPWIPLLAGRKKGKRGERISKQPAKEKLKGLSSSPRLLYLPPHFLLSIIFFLSFPYISHYSPSPPPPPLFPSFPSSLLPGLILYSLNSSLTLSFVFFLTKQFNLLFIMKFPFWVLVY